ncbi:hypothetical protein ACLBWS_05380 [Brucellaceae bacterium D45D]
MLAKLIKGLSKIGLVFLGYGIGTIGTIPFFMGAITLMNSGFSTEPFVLLILGILLLVVGAWLAELL